VLGVGGQNFAVAEGTISPLARLQERGRGVRWGAAHNTFIQVGAELGVPGLLLFMGLIATAFVSLRRVTRLAGRSGPAAADLSRMAQALTAALIGFVTGSVFLSLAYHDILYTLVAFTLALAKIAHHADTPCAPRSRRVVDLGSSRALAARPRLLFLAQSLPYPPHSGVAARTLHILESCGALSISTWSPSRACITSPSAAARGRGRGARLRAVASFVAEPTPIPNEQSAVRKLWDHMAQCRDGTSVIPITSIRPGVRRPAPHGVTKARTGSGAPG